MSSSYNSFSDNEYFYQSAMNDGTMPSDVSCNTYFMDPKISAGIDAKCNVDFNNFSKLKTKEAEDCVKRQLCQNKTLAIDNTHKQMKNLQSKQRLNDMTSLYNENIINTINLGIGILAMSYFIFTNKKVFGL